jgi:hypothetical protein
LRRCIHCRTWYAKISVPVAETVTLAPVRCCRCRFTAKKGAGWPQLPSLNMTSTAILPCSAGFQALGQALALFVGELRTATAASALTGKCCFAIAANPASRLQI